MSATTLQLAAVEPLAAALREDKLGDFSAVSPVAACLMPLLEALRWRGSPRDVAEALPHFANSLDLVDLRNVLVTLGFESHCERTSLDKIDPRFLPCLYVQDDGKAYVIRSLEAGKFNAFDGANGRDCEFSPTRTRGEAYFFTRHKYR